MASDITLFIGNISEKETDYYPSYIYPVAFLSDDYAGIRATDNENIHISSSETNNREILAAIRGAYLAQELSYVSPDLLDSCICACTNQPNDAQKIVAEIVKKQVPPLKLKQARRFIPGNIDTILSNLAENDIIFDGNEIEFEISRGTIKKSKHLEEILFRNRTIETEVDLEEYGQEIDLEIMIEGMNLGIHESKIVRPFFDIYLSKCDQKNMKVATYASSNSLGFCILSKLTRNKNIDLDFIVHFRTDYFGDINNIQYNNFISPIVKLRKSSEKVKMEFYSKEIMEQCYGKQFKPDLMHKMPFIFRSDEAITYMDGNNLITRVTNLELAKIVHPIFNSIRQRFLYATKYGIKHIN